MVKMGDPIIRFSLLALAIVFLTYAVPSSIGLGAKGFDTSFVLQQFTFYLSGGIFLVGLIFAFVYEYRTKKDDSKFGSSIVFSSPGEKPSLSLFKGFTNLQLFLLSFVLFGVVGLFTIFQTQTSFTGIGTIEQQFTPTAQLLYSLFLVTGAENLGLALVLAVALVSIRIVGRKMKLDGASFTIISILIPSLLGGTYWLINHLLRYSNQDIALLTVFAFGFFMSLFILLTGSFVVGWVMHIMNNLMVELTKFTSSDTSQLYIIGLLIIIAILYVFIYRGRLLGSNK